MKGRDRAPAVLPDPASYPSVTVQVPIYNEMYVAERLIRALGHFDYPADRLEIQVLDDSTDETREIAERAVDRLVAGGFHATYMHRSSRDGFKAGALAHGLTRARGQFIGSSAGATRSDSRTNRHPASCAR